MIRQRASIFGTALMAMALAATAAACSAHAADIACDKPASEVLGTSRVIEIDTTGGPLYGEQYPPSGLLQPGEVVLTFDDGPHPSVTRDILAALAAQCVKATFFSVGRMAKQFPDVLKETYEQGHTVGSHTWSHRNLGGSGYERGVEQIESAVAQIDAALPQKSAPFFRFPYLSDNKRLIAYLKTRNIATFSIDVDSFDWRNRTPDRMLRNVMNGLARTGGGIILFHDIHANTAHTMPAVLEALRAGNYKVVHLVAKAPVTAVTPVASAGATDKAPRAPRRKQRRQQPAPSSGFTFF